MFPPSNHFQQTKPPLHMMSSNFARTAFRDSSQRAPHVGPLVCSLLLLLSQILLPACCEGDERLKGIACRSVHLGYPAASGTAFYVETTVDKSAEGTYFMAAGFRMGYFGIQELANGKKLVIFSVWDPTAGDDPKSVPEEKRVRLLHRDEQVRVGRFGGEGTGGQSFFDYDWQSGETYRFLVTAKPDGPDRTAYSGFFYLNSEQQWKHLVTFSTLSEGRLLSGYYSFVEDFRRNRISTTKERRATFTNGWVLTEQGEWVELHQARFTADSNPVLNIDAGPVERGFFLTTGGDVENTTTPLRNMMQRPSGLMRPLDLPEFP